NLGQNLILNFFGNGFALHDFPFGTNYCALGKDKVSSFSGTCPIREPQKLRKTAKLRLKISQKIIELLQFSSYFYIYVLTDT
ncbi:MAG: hypothetical protein ACOZAN_04990, partial [Patescibacteria group bacterium]